eukprot:768180-Hanusia_phi.AAC.1
MEKDDKLNHKTARQAGSRLLCNTFPVAADVISSLHSPSPHRSILLMWYRSVCSRSACAPVNSTYLSRAEALAALALEGRPSEGLQRPRQWRDR